MDARIGQVVREGKTIFYAFIGGRELSNLVESADAADIETALQGKAPAAKAVAKKPSTYHNYAVTVTPKYEFSVGMFRSGSYQVEIAAKTREEAVKEARRRYKENSSFPGDTATYTAKMA